MITPRVVTIPCPFSTSDDDCPNTLTATVSPGQPAAYDAPREPVTVEDIRGCYHIPSPFGTALPVGIWVGLESRFIDQLVQDDQDARELED